MIINSGEIFEVGRSRDPHGSARHQSLKLRVHTLKISDKTRLPHHHTPLPLSHSIIPAMLSGSTLELSWDHEIENSLEPSLSVTYTGSSAFLFSPSPSQYNFSVSHRTHCQDVPSPPPTQLTCGRPTRT